ncbi:MAG: hypothetical protein DRP76_02125 [Candidatus Omnitrophota bacterium]|nr:MAG: hypothetical protein DRP76_02125 [Candidatus Omnitrophota bacterium]
MRHIDTKKREEEILQLVVESYIKESNPISSGYLCQRFKLPYSSATVRNVMESLEKRGFLSHIHTSSGRVPTEEGFRKYVKMLRKKQFKERKIKMDLSARSIEEIILKAVDILANLSGYLSLGALSFGREKVLFRGTRFIFEQPEFEDLEKARALFYLLEVKISILYKLLFSSLDEHINILVGDEIGAKEISDCSLVISGLQIKKIEASLALLGPMRMDYARAISSICTVRRKLKELIGER